jgi:hypothetical protein
VPPGAPPTAAAGRLFFIIDHLSNKKLLVDTGSAYSIFPFQSSKRPFGPRLTAANGQRIRCWGSRRRPLLLAGQEYQWNFIQAAVSFPILGIDFLKHFELLVDVVSEKLIPRSSVPCSGGGMFTGGCTASGERNLQFQNLRSGGQRRVQRGRPGGGVFRGPL